MNLFEIEDNKLRIQPEAYALQPFKKIWDRDKSKGKVVALEELAYIYFMTDYQSDFINDPSDSEKDKAVRKYCITTKNWEPDSAIKEAIEFYKVMQETVATKLLEKSYVAVGKLMKFYDDVDLTLTTDKGTPVYNAKQLADTIKSTGDIIKSLRSLEEVVKQEKDLTSNKLRGDRQKSIYEDE